MKARSCPHVYKDKFKNTVRKDSETAQFDIARKLFSLACILSLILGCIYLKGVFLHSGPMTRELFV